METPEEILSTLKVEIAQAASTAELKSVETKFLGKSGSLIELAKSVSQLPKEDRPAFGKRVNLAKSEGESLLASRLEQLKVSEQLSQFERERVDITMPGERLLLGREHILQQTINRIKRVLGGLGFQYVDSPELEEFRFNFKELNYPKDHPAMDDQDTFWIDDKYLLRTQCTAFQGRRLAAGLKPPFRLFTIGRTFRNEKVDATHGHTFHQVDCFMIDEGISMAHLKGTLGAFARAMIGPDVKVRFRPDFFPFVEPGVDYAISTPKLKGGEWIELGGAGLIHPNILKEFGIDREKYSGFAFGLGVERIPMMAYGVSDLRPFLQNDFRFLDQFKFEPLWS